LPSFVHFLWNFDTFSLHILVLVWRLLWRHAIVMLARYITYCTVGRRLSRAQAIRADCSFYIWLIGQLTDGQKVNLHNWLVNRNSVARYLGQLTGLSTWLAGWPTSKQQLPLVDNSHVTICRRRKHKQLAYAVSLLFVFEFTVKCFLTVFNGE